VSLTPAQITALHTEFTTDPKSLGYAAQMAAGSDQGLANLINSVENPPETGPVSSVGAEAVWECIAIADWNALTTAQQQYVLGAVAFPTLNPANAQVSGAFSAIFSGKSGGTLARLQALATRNYTRAEVLFGAGTVVTTNDVALAFGRGQLAAH